MSETPEPPIRRSIVLIGMMGAGKSTVGRRLASRLHLDFIDADTEIEAAAGCGIEEIFRLHGEAAFRAGERRIFTRLLDGPVRIIGAGGGAFNDPETRARIEEKGVSVWLRADLDLLLRRVARRNNRPLLKGGDPRAILARLMTERHPIYALADITVDSADGPPDATVERVIDGLRGFWACRGEAVCEAEP